MGSDYDYALQMRKSLEELGSYLSTRNIEDISNLLHAGTPYKAITARVTQDLTEDEKLKIEREMDKKFRSDSVTTSGVVVEYKTEKIPLEVLMKRYPITDKGLLKIMKKQSPGLFKEYMYVLEKHGLISL